MVDDVAGREEATAVLEDDIENAKIMRRRRRKKLTIILEDMFMMKRKMKIFKPGTARKVGQRLMTFGYHQGIFTNDGIVTKPLTRF